MERQFRLRLARDFVRLRAEGRSYRSQWMLVSLMPNGLSHNRYGFVTSKQLGNAVVRNRMRRLMREAVRQLHPQLHPGFDVVLVARPVLVEQPFQVVQRLIEEMFNRAGVVKLKGDKL